MLTGHHPLYGTIFCPGSFALLLAALQAQSLSLCSLLGVESNEAELVRTKDDSQKDQPGPDPGAPLPEPVLRRVDLAAGGLSLVPDFASHQL